LHGVAASLDPKRTGHQPLDTDLITTPTAPPPKAAPPRVRRDRKPGNHLTRNTNWLSVPTLAGAHPNWARAELSNTKRRAMYHEMEQLLRDDGGVIIPMYANYVDARSKKIARGPTIGSNYDLDGRKCIERWCGPSKNRSKGEIR
jgi:hypothetical protein